MELAAPDRSGFIEVNRTRLRLWEWGDEAAPPIICLHGAFDHGRMWDGIAPRLAALGYRVVAPDLRGHGDSGRLSSGMVWAATALDLALLARALGPPVGLVGHSFGGGQALFVAGVWPELVRWVVNLDGLGPPSSALDENDSDIAGATTQGLDAAERMLFGPPRVHASRARMAERRRQVNVRLPEAWVDHLVAHGSTVVEGGFVWKADPLLSVGLPGDFDLDHLEAQHEMTECPVLVLTGGEPDTWSEMTFEEVAGRLSGLRDVRHHVVAGAGHYVHIERPEVVLGHIATFLDEGQSC